MRDFFYANVADAAALAPSHSLADVSWLGLGLTRPCLATCCDTLITPFYHTRSLALLTIFHTEGSH